jgi:crotonobetainyl-CoA:carnitine CoA-transferase CaiB-like acyl-CoA transferase|tara:strand:+ start:1936 stop:2373 length:438 start_codon:yes stop_codon:yes gene_type:complete
MLLAPYRVLDLTQSQGVLCAQILGDLGAGVIQIEPPGGAPGRHLAPFLHNREDPENSLYWWGYARGKRSIELDIEADADTFMHLVERTDFLIEAEPVGSLAARGFGYSALAARDPRPTGRPRISQWSQARAPWPLPATKIARRCA